MKRSAIVLCMLSACGVGEPDTAPATEQVKQEVTGCPSYAYQFTVGSFGDCNAANLQAAMDSANARCVSETGAPCCRVEPYCAIGGGYQSSYARAWAVPNMCGGYCGGYRFDLNCSCRSDCQSCTLVTGLNCCCRDKRDRCG